MAKKHPFPVFTGRGCFFCVACCDPGELAGLDFSVAGLLFHFTTCPLHAPLCRADPCLQTAPPSYRPRRLELTTCYRVVSDTLSTFLSDSCKKRGWCPSCCAKRQAAAADHVAEDFLPAGDRLETRGEEGGAAQAEHCISLRAACDGEGAVHVGVTFVPLQRAASLTRRGGISATSAFLRIARHTPRLTTCPW